MLLALLLACPGSSPPAVPERAVTWSGDTATVVVPGASLDAGVVGGRVRSAELLDGALKLTLTRDAGAPDVRVVGTKTCGEDTCRWELRTTPGAIPAWTAHATLIPYERDCDAVASEGPVVHARATPVGDALVLDLDTRPVGIWRFDPDIRVTGAEVRGVTRAPGEDLVRIVLVAGPDVAVEGAVTCVGPDVPWRWTPAEGVR